MKNENLEGGSLPLAPTADAFSATPSAGSAPQRPLLLFLGIFLIFSLFSCATMQDDVYVDTVSGNAEFSAFEMRFAEIDAAYFASDESLKDKNLEIKAEALLSDMENAPLLYYTNKL